MKNLKQPEKPAPNSRHHIYTLQLLQHLHPRALPSGMGTQGQRPVVKLPMLPASAGDPYPILIHPMSSFSLSVGPSQPHSWYSPSSFCSLPVSPIQKGLENLLTYYFIPIPLPFKAHSSQVVHPTILVWLPTASILLTPVNSLLSWLGTNYHSLPLCTFSSLASPTPHSPDFSTSLAMSPHI